jgi:hypothetical protein
VKEQPPEPAFFSSGNDYVHILFKRNYKPRKNGKPEGNEYHSIKGIIQTITYVPSSRTIKLNYFDDKSNSWGTHKTIIFKKASLADHNAFVQEYYDFVKGETFIQKL